jgi:hypothetical protein
VVVSPLQSTRTSLARKEKLKEMRVAESVLAYWHYIPNSYNSVVSSSHSQTFAFLMPERPISQSLDSVNFFQNISFRPFIPYMTGLRDLVFLLHTFQLALNASIFSSTCTYHVHIWLYKIWRYVCPVNDCLSFLQKSLLVVHWIIRWRCVLFLRGWGHDAQ